jgi:Mg2+/Co2+ transporter CorB
LNSISTFWLAFILFGLILSSAFFSSSETSIMAINRYKLKSLSKTNKKARRVEKLLLDLDSLIGTILLGNNLVNILASSIATILAIRILGEGSIIYISILLTFIILIFAETAPKTFAARNPEKIALPASLIIKLCTKIFKPFVWIIAILSKSFIKLLGFDNQDNNKIGFNELKMIVNDTKSITDPNYREMLLNVINLENVKVEDIMIPKAKLISIDINKKEDILKKISHSKTTRILVFDEASSNIIGVLHLRSVANLYAKNKFDINDLLSIIDKPYFIPEGTSVSQQLTHFQAKKERLGLVVNEYGEIKGLITLENVLEEIIGKFTFSPNNINPDFIKQKDGSYLVNPKVSIREINKILGTNLKIGKTKTLNGLIIDTIQNIPKRDISLKIDNLLIEIIQIKDQTIKLVKLTKLN